MSPHSLLIPVFFFSHIFKLVRSLSLSPSLSSFLFFSFFLSLSLYLHFFLFLFLPLHSYPPLSLSHSHCLSLFTIFIFLCLIVAVPADQLCGGFHNLSLVRLGQERPLQELDGLKQKRKRNKHTVRAHRRVTREGREGHRRKKKRILDNICVAWDIKLHLSLHTHTQTLSTILLLLFLLLLLLLLLQELEGVFGPFEDAQLDAIQSQVRTILPAMDVTAYTAHVLPEALLAIIEKVRRCSHQEVGEMSDEW